MPATRTLAGPAGGRTAVRALPPLVPLAVVTGISPLATDMYIPGLPGMAVDLGTTPAVAQLSLTAFLVAFALGMLVVGPVSDGLGRRRIMVVGTALFVLTSVACALAPDASVLLVARLLQGLAGAAGAVVGRAMVTDVLDGDRRARVIGLLSAINAVAPVVAPLLGGLLLRFGTWRLTFWALAVTGTLLLVLVLTTFPETLPAERRSHGAGVSASLRRMGVLLRMPRFVLYLVTSCVATVGFFAYIATSSFVFQELYGYSESRYTLVFATNASAMIVSTLLFSRLVGRVSEDRLLSVGLLVATAGSAAVLVLALTSAPGGALWAALAVVTGAQGLVITGSATRTQALGHAMPGTAAALSGGLAFGVGGLGTPLAGLLGGTAVAMGTVMLLGLGVGALLQTVVARRVASAG
ncbi:multidrug effflux MFS transporter [Microlunatus flavus]|uniref:MFS transporter, DHA1 family, bicyclomycin/chloramphenicol resistance protein n=1 Tax=Microlunatus flavus TaxID=1036181 RepID=A0A1H9JG89_9ACTN|nr:multidrug effflux MFS transporter [Microlunatus flavus]SEQ85788.1 MFS transporter, DHA1 family, bicyclomycin/chloramphenicol resistance protein [Microlunatus flavus]